MEPSLMKYRMKTANAEWTIEPSSMESWILKERAEADWCAVGTFRTPNEAAVVVGARSAGVSDTCDRPHARLRCVLSCWETLEQH
jgi:hypothetical protein